MVELSGSQLDRVFHALADATRRSMLQAMADGSQTVGDLAAPHSMSFAAASKHVKVLESAGLLRREVRGREHVCHLSVAPLAAVSDFLAAYASFWSARLDALEEVIEAEAKTELRSKRPRANTKSKKGVVT
jgi:DNA-binding transcriptional ArsR family regulator